MCVLFIVERHLHKKWRSLRNRWSLKNMMKYEVIEKSKRIAWRKLLVVKKMKQWGQNETHFVFPLPKTNNSHWETFCIPKGRNRLLYHLHYEPLVSGRVYSRKLKWWFERRIYLSTKEIFGVHVGFQVAHFFLFPSEAVLVAGRDIRSRGYPTGSRQSDTFSPFSACAPHDSMDLLWRSLHPRKPVVSLASQTLGGWMGNLLWEGSQG